MSSTYRFAGSFVVRMTGLALAAVGVLLVLLAGLVAVTSLPPVVLGVGLVVALAAWLVLLVSVTVLRRREVVRFDETGYRVRSIRGAGVRQGRWTDVEDVTAPTVGGARCVLLRLRDGRTTTIPVDVLAGSTDAFVRDLQEHLNRGHGYRPIPGAGGRPGA